MIEQIIYCDLCGIKGAHITLSDWATGSLEIDVCEKCNKAVEDIFNEYTRKNHELLEWRKQEVDKLRTKSIAGINFEKPLQALDDLSIN